MRLLYSIILLTLVLLMPISCLADKYREQVEGQLAVIKLLTKEKGYEETHNDKFDKLSSNKSDSFSFQLRKDKKYLVLAVCDNDCKDMDLVLYDENNNEVAKDKSTDSLPVVEVNPKWTGKFKLKVIMESCSNNPCTYGIGILGKDKGSSL